jgi:hypothetical protein
MATSPPILLACNNSTNPSGYWGAVSSILHIGNNKEPNNNALTTKRITFESNDIFEVFIIVGIKKGNKETLFPLH